MAHQVRRLSEADAEAYRAIRLEGLRLHPEAFAMSFEEESAHALEEVARLLNEHAVFGGHVGDDLAGVVGFRREPWARERHKGVLWGMYVRGSARGSGLAAMLVEAVLDHARGRVRQVGLTVNAENPAARRLYERSGFRAYGIEPGSLALDGRYCDEVLMLRYLDED